MKIVKKIAISLGILAGLATSLQAHTIEYGFSNAGPGSVTFWFGSYHSLTEASADGIPNEGFLQIQGINGNAFPLTALDFSGAIGTAPDADPTTGYVQGYRSSTSLNTTLWQTATFTSVTPGDYSFIFNESASVTGASTGTSAVFAAWDSGIRSGTFTLTQAVTGPPPSNGVPDSGSTAALLGLGLVGLASAARRLKK